MKNRILKRVLALIAAAALTASLAACGEKPQMSMNATSDGNITVDMVNAEGGAQSTMSVPEGEFVTVISTLEKGSVTVDIVKDGSPVGGGDFSGSSVDAWDLGSGDLTVSAKAAGKPTGSVLIAHYSYDELNAIAPDKAAQFETEEMRKAREAEALSALAGTWVADRANLRVAKEGFEFIAAADLPSSASELTRVVWKAAPDGDALVSLPPLTQTDYVFAEDGSIASADTVETDQVFRLSLGEDGKLIWNNPDTGYNMKFERMSAKPELPSADEIADELFRRAGEVKPGTAGSSLREAAAAAELLRFASRSELWDCDVKAFRASVLEAWEGLSDDERSAFDGSIMTLISDIDSCFSSWDEAKAAFEDAGAAGTVGALISDPMNELSWRTLVSSIMTMGNSEGL
jgi:hypothetical protein